VDNTHPVWHFDAVYKESTCWIRAASATACTCWTSTCRAIQKRTQPRSRSRNSRCVADWRCEARQADHGRPACRFYQVRKSVPGRSENGPSGPFSFGWMAVFFCFPLITAMTGQVFLWTEAGPLAVLVVLGKRDGQKLHPGHKPVAL